jgi:hypothetical protein
VLGLPGHGAERVAVDIVDASQARPGADRAADRSGFAVVPGGKFEIGLGITHLSRRHPPSGKVSEDYTPFQREVDHIAGLVHPPNCSRRRRPRQLFIDRNLSL